MSYFFLWFFCCCCWFSKSVCKWNEVNECLNCNLVGHKTLYYTHILIKQCECVFVRTPRTHIKSSLSTHSPKNCILRQKLFESCAYFKHILMTTKMCILWAICGLLNWFRSEKWENRWISYRLPQWICVDFAQLPVFAWKLPLHHCQSLLNHFSFLLWLFNSKNCQFWRPTAN